MTLVHVYAIQIDVSISFLYLRQIYLTFYSFLNKDLNKNDENIYNDTTEIIR